MRISPPRLASVPIRPFGSGAAAILLLALVAHALERTQVQAFDGPKKSAPPKAPKSTSTKKGARTAAAGSVQPNDGPDEAPTGFNNSTNGFQTQDVFTQDRTTFEKVEAIVPDGLGPVYNATSCIACHQNPVTGSSSQISEIRAGHVEQGKFVEPPGGSLIHQRAIDAAAQEHVPPEENIRTLRMSTNLLGNGFVEVIPDSVILAIQACQPPDLRGYAIPVTVTVSGTKKDDGTFDFQSVQRLGRFGWKCQEASLLNFSAGAYLNEMGITNPLNPKESKSNGRDVSQFDQVLDPEDEVDPKNDDNKTHPFGDDAKAFARFIRSTKAPPRDFSLANLDDVKAGEQIFKDQTTGSNKIGCAICHQPCYTTPPVGTPIELPDSHEPASDLPDSKVPNALGNKIIHPYSDFMLHDIGTGDGIVQTQHAQRPPRGAEKAKRANYPKSDESHILRIRRTPRLKSVPPAAASSPKNAYPTQCDQCPPVTHVDDLDQETANKIRTAPLWGLRVRPQLMHDGLSLTVEEAIVRHSVNHTTAGPSGVKLPDNYNNLTAVQKRQLKAFLNSL